MRVGDEYACEYVTAVIAVRAKILAAVARHGEMVHDGPFAVDRRV